MMSDIQLLPRHIQNFSDAKELQPHWGYVSRVLPCTNDPGSCAYLDNVYHAHDLGMMYIGIIWATIGGILFLWASLRIISQRSVEMKMSGVGKQQVKLEEEANQPHPITQFSSNIQKIILAIKAESRKWLLPDGPRMIFGRTSRLQIVILATLAGYLFIWSFLGFSWKTYVTPVKKYPQLHNTRTTLGPWADRVGVLAFGMLPFSILLASRESLLSILTGIPYQQFNFLHRWLGHIIFFQSLLHTIGWVIVEAKLYQPQPSTAKEFISEIYMIWGCVAMILLTIMWLLTWQWSIKKTGYEFFRKAHYVMAMIFLGACYGHWEHLKCFIIPSFILWGMDRAARLIRTFLLHYSYVQRKDGTTMAGFHSTQANVQLFEDYEGGHVIRLDLDQTQSTCWDIGQHFFLTFPQLSIWQAHPFTPLLPPFITSEGKARHSYLFRAKTGETKKLATLVKGGMSQTNVILTGPYGRSVLSGLTDDENIVCIAGGTGITFVLPILFHLARHSTIQQKISLLWVIRYMEDAEWIRSELELIRSTGKVDVVIKSTRDIPSTPSSDAKLEIETQPLQSSRPNLKQIVQSFVESNVNSSSVFASGPGEMLTELRSIVAQCNDGKRVLRGEKQANVRFISDNRLEW